MFKASVKHRLCTKVFRKWLHTGKAAIVHREIDLCMKVV